LGNSNIQNIVAAEREDPERRRWDIQKESTKGINRELERSLVYG
jgi:hypothetical protein